MLGAAGAVAFGVAGLWPWAAAMGLLTAALGSTGLRTVDRPIVVRADADAIVVDDPSQDEPWVLPLARLRALRIHRHAQDDERRDVWLMLADRLGPSLTLHLRHDPAVAPEVGDIEVAALHALIGYDDDAMPPARPARQVFDDPAGQLVRHLRAHAPPGVTDRAALRLWRARPDPASPRTADGWIELDGDLWRWNEGRMAEEGVFALPRLTRLGDTVRLELATDRALRFVAPAIAAFAAEGSEAATDRWLEPREGAVLLAWLIARWPDGSWPAALRKRVLGPADGSRVRLPATMRRP